MADRKSIKSFPNGLPLRHERIHERDKALVVSWFNEVCHLMYYNVLKTFAWLLGEFGVEPNRARGLVAASPHCFHLPDKDALRLDANHGCPCGDQMGDRGSDLLPIPPGDQGLSCRHFCARANGEH